MDIIAHYTVQFVVLAALAAYMGLIALLAAGLVWIGFHMLHDHWTLTQTWQQARGRLFH